MTDESVRETPQDTPLPAKTPATSMGRRRVRNGNSDALGETMKPWMKAWILWYLGPGPRPKIAQQTAKASELAGFPITRDALYKMRARPDVKLFQSAVQGSVTEAAKEALALQHQHYVDAHLRGLNMALAEGDHRAIPAYTVPILDRIAPKKADTQIGNKTIIVNVNETTARQLMSGDPGVGEVLVEAAEIEIEPEAVPE